MEDLIQAFGINWKLFTIQIFNFGLLLLLLWHFLYKPVFAMLAKRQKIVAQGVQDAENAEKQLALAETEKSAIIKKSNQDAEIIISQAEKRGEEKRGEILFQAENQAGAILKTASLEATDLKNTMISGAEKEIAQTAILAAEKILKK